MTLLSLSRLRRLDAAELTWRAREATHVAIERLSAQLQKPRWHQPDLLRAFSRSPRHDRVRSQLSDGRWQDAHAALAREVHEGACNFVIAPRLRQEIVRDIQRRFPAATDDARVRGDRVIAGRYDLLGYRELEFDGAGWHTDPVNGKTAPLHFWTQVPYLSPECGDHKVTWEFNRHQHWLELGRAYWLTSDGRYRQEFLRQLGSWLDANPPLMGINWASMLELSFRSLSWIWALNFFAAGAEDDDSPWIIDLLLGIDRQLDHVERHLSHYFSPNTHLLGEALALYVAGRTLPWLRASTRREAIGRRVLLQEIGRQIGADGGHCERSPHYHRYTLDFYLLALAVARLTDDTAAATFERACARLADAARALADDRGRLPLIGDDDGGSLLPIARRPADDVRDSLAIAAALTARSDVLIGEPTEEVCWMLAHEKFTDVRLRLDRAPQSQPAVSTALPATGYYISRNADGDHLIVDGGTHGYLNGGHAHADALSLTFTRRGQPLLIDTGTGLYTIDPAVRDRFRSSNLHNTLVLNGRSQSVTRGPFHWHQTTDASTRRWRTNRQFDYFVGWHDGYTPATHSRHVLMLHGDLLMVADCITSPTGNITDVIQASVHWHLHPDWNVEVADNKAALAAGTERIALHTAGGTIAKFVADASGLGWYAPAYGRIEPTTALRVDARGRVPLWLVSVFSLDPAHAVEQVTCERLDVSAGTPHHAAVVRIRRAGGHDHIVIAEPAEDGAPLRWQSADIEADALMFYGRERDGEFTAFAIVDTTTVRSDRHPLLQSSYSSRVPDLFVDLGRDHENRKAS